MELEMEQELALEVPAYLTQPYQLTEITSHLLLQVVRIQALK